MDHNGSMEAKGEYVMIGAEQKGGMLRVRWEQATVGVQDTQHYVYGIRQDT